MPLVTVSTSSATAASLHLCSAGAELAALRNLNQRLMVENRRLLQRPNRGPSEVIR
jgi:hypothetical protein